MAKKKVYVEGTPIPIWNQMVSYYISDSVETCAKAVEKSFPGASDILGDSKFYSGCALTLTDNTHGLTHFIIMLSVDKQDKDGDQVNKILVHECVHAAWRILDTVGVDLTVDNHEALAYLTEFLYDNGKRCLEIYKSKK